MKNTAMTLMALAASCACASTALAQSSVTLFGVADVNLRRTSDGGVTQTSLSPDGNTPSRLGFRGTEDLGGGLSASFWLEAGIDLSSGAMPNPAKFFHRRSTVSLASATAGEIRLGRDYTPSFMGYVMYDPFFSAGIGAAFNVLAGPAFSNGSKALTTVRADNALQYFSTASWGAWNAQLMWAPSEGVAGNDYRGFRAGYAAGALDAAVSYGVTNVVDGQYSIATLGGAYTVGALKVAVLGLRTAYLARREQVNWLGLTYRLEVGEVRASVVDKVARGGGTDGNNARQLALGYVHYLSKRTALYSTVSRLANQGASASVVSIGSSIVPGRTSSGIELGVRHTF